MKNNYPKALESDQSRQVLEGSQCMEDKNITGEFPAMSLAWRQVSITAVPGYSHSFKICKVLLPWGLLEDRIWGDNSCWKVGVEIPGKRQRSSSKSCVHTAKYLADQWTMYALMVRLRTAQLRLKELSEIWGTTYYGCGERVEDFAFDAGPVKSLLKQHQINKHCSYCNRIQSVTNLSFTRRSTHPK